MQQFDDFVGERFAVENCGHIVQFIPTERQCQIASLVLSYNNDFLVIDKPRQVGMTTMFVLMGLFVCMTNENKHVVIISPTRQMSKFVGEKLNMLVKLAVPGSKRFRDGSFKSFVAERLTTSAFGNRKDHKTFDNGSTLKILPSHIDHIRGSKFDVVFLDEAQLIKDQLVVQMLKLQCPTLNVLSWTSDNIHPIPEQWTSNVVQYEKKED